MNRSLVSFRDPAGKVIIRNEKVLRLVYEEYVENTRIFLASSFANELLKNGMISDTKIIPIDKTQNILNENAYKAESLLLEHNKISFISYPYEWCPQMLFEAAVLTIRLAEKGLKHNYGLKDATPFNILFEGTRPVFVDILSFELRDQFDMIWLPLSQFEQTFIIPLLLHRYWGLTPDMIFNISRNGVSIEKAYRSCGFIDRFRGNIFVNVTIPYFISKITSHKAGINYKKTTTDRALAEYVLKRTYDHAKKRILKINKYNKRRSDWLGYEAMISDSELYSKSKKEFIIKFIREFSPSSVLDVGCNTGCYSEIAAENNAAVVAIDNDHLVIEHLWHKADQKNLNILPLVIDIANPTPSIGWQNCETFSFLERARGHFQLVLMLAIVHHLLITERIPLDHIMLLISELTTEYAIIEYVGTEDPMFKALCRGRDNLFLWYNETSFNNSANKYFEKINVVDLNGQGRKLFLYKKIK